AIGLAAAHTITVLATVEIVRSKDDETAIRQVRCEIVIIRVISLDHVFGHAPASMLADDDGTPFARFEILRHEQYAPGKNVWPHIKYHLMANPFLGVVHLARSRIEGRERFIESTQDFFCQVPPIRLGAFNEL